MKNLSRMTTHREREARAVESVLTVHAELGGDGLAAFFADVLEDGETPPDCGFFFELLRRKIVRSREQMLEAERLHRDEITNDRIPRARRDELVRELRREIIDWRQVLRPVIGKDKSIEIGFVTPLTRDPRVLVRTANVIVGNLERVRNGELEILKPGVHVDLAVIIESVRALSDDLAAVIEEIDLARRALEGAVIHKQEALDAFDELFPRSSRLVEALFTLCGEGELAKRVRPSVRKMVRPALPPDHPEGTVSESPLPVTVSSKMAVHPRPSDRREPSRERLVAGLRPELGESHGHRAGLAAGDPRAAGPSGIPAGRPKVAWDRG